MNKFVEGIGLIVLGVLMICIAALVGGTFLWLIWEDSITAMFPSAVSTGVLAATLGWWQSVKIVWIFTLLLKTVNTTTKTTKD